MKKLLFFLFVSVGLNAQFNYQAIVKDSDGNPVTNNQVKFKFSLMYQSSTATPVYVEEHTVTTPPDGVNNISVGGGTVVNGTFSDIDWSQSVFMKEELDTGSGYQDMGTKQIASVPVAEYARSSGSSISSLTFVDSSNNLSIGTSVSLDGERNVAIGIGVLSDESSNAKHNVGIGYGALSNITSGTGNIAVGDSSLYTLDNGYNNVAIGDITLYKNLSNDNIAVGGKAMSNNTSGTANIAVGTISLYNNSDGSNSIAIGHGALYGNNGYGDNIAIGNRAMYSSSNISSNTGSWNIAIGRESLRENSTGSANIAIGEGAMYSNTTGGGNIALGSQTLSFNTIGTRNVAIGNSALRINTTGYDNIAIGNSLSGNTTGKNNIGIGTWSQLSNITGDNNLSVGNNTLQNNLASRNTAIGNESLSKNVSGTVNTAVGYLSLYHNVSGDRNVALGDGTLNSNEDGSYNVALGSIALRNNVSGSSNVSIGDASLYNSISSNNVALGDGAGYDLNTVNSDYNTFIGTNANTVSGTQIYNSTAIGANSIVTTSNTIQLGDTDVTLVNTSAKVSANDYLINGGESLVDIVSQLPSSDDYAALSAAVDDLSFSTSGNFLTSDDNKFSVWYQIEVSNSDGISDELSEQTYFIINSVSSATFMNIITIDNYNETQSCDLATPNLTQMLEGEVNHSIDGDNYLVSVSEFSANNFTVKYNSNTHFDSNEDGIGWIKHSYTKISSDLIRFDQYHSDDFNDHESYTLQKLSDDYTDLYGDLIQYCQ